MKLQYVERVWHIHSTRNIDGFGSDELHLMVSHCM